MITGTKEYPFTDKRGRIGKFYLEINSKDLHWYGIQLKLIYPYFNNPTQNVAQSTLKYESDICEDDLTNKIDYFEEKIKVKMKEAIDHSGLEVDMEEFHNCELATELNKRGFYFELT